MKALIFLFIFVPLTALGQLRVATGTPLTGESVVVTGKESGKLETNHWLKADDQVQSGKNSSFQITIGGNRFQSHEETSVRIVSSKSLEILRGCLSATFSDEDIIGHGNVKVSSEKTGKGIVCFHSTGLLVLSEEGELSLKDREENLGSVKSGTYRIYSFERNSLTTPRSLSPIQLAELLGSPTQNMVNLISFVPYGLTGKDVVNTNGVLFNEMLQLDSAVKKIQFKVSDPVPGGEWINLKTGEIIPAPLTSYYDHNQDLRYFIPIEKKVLPIKNEERPYFYRENYHKEVTGGVRGLFDPQRLNGVSP